METDFRLTVAICTHNRCASLRRALRSLASLPEIGRETKVLVIDNCSRDTTKRTVVEMVQRLPYDLRYTYEPRPGVAYARNRAIRMSHGAVMAFIDDDETVAPGWAKAVQKAFEDPRVDLIFSRLYAVDETGARLTDPLLKVPERDYGTAPIEVTQENRDQFDFGTGISAYRLSTLRKLGGFRTELGTTGTRQFGGEDTEMYERFIRAGRGVFYWPDAIVYHHISRQRRSFRNLVARYRDRSFSAARLEVLPPCRRVLGVPLFSIRKGLVSCKRLVVSALARDGATKARALGLAGQVGTALGYRARWLEERNAQK